MNTPDISQASRCELRIKLYYLIEVFFINRNFCSQRLDQLNYCQENVFFVSLLLQCLTNNTANIFLNTHFIKPIINYYIESDLNDFFN